MTNEKDDARRDEQASANGVATASPNEKAASFTPGPWRVDRSSPERVYIRPEGNGIGLMLASLSPDSFTYGDSGESIYANANLLAAAPELLTALRAVVANHCANENLFCSTCSRARKVIAKAEGRA